MDEPINRLDISSRSRFEQAVKAFQGTVLAIIHDRYIIERFASSLEDMRQARRQGQGDKTRGRWYLPKLLFWLAFSLEGTTQREVVR